MTNHDIAIELLKSLHNALDADEDVHNLIKNSLSISKHNVEHAIEKISLEQLTGLSLDNNCGKCYRVAYSPTDVYLTYYCGERQINNVKKVIDGEWLLSFWFPCGAYTFNSGLSTDDYPTDTFNNMIEEIKLMKPKYFDSLNKNFYFDTSKAKEVVEVLPMIFNKYKGEVQKEVDKKRIAKLELELEKLKQQG